MPLAKRLRLSTSWSKPMRMRLLATALALAAGAGLVRGDPGPPAAAVGYGPGLLPPSGANAAPPDGWRDDAVFGSAEPAAVTAGPQGQFWLRGEYLLWWAKGSRLPPLVTSGLPGVTGTPGALGQTGTTVTYGGSDVDDGPRSGGRFSGGLWLDQCHTFGLEGSYFFLGSRNTRFDAASDARLGSPLIARPFFDVLTGTQNAQLVAFPALAGGNNVLTATGTGLASGNVHASSYSRLHGADVNAFCGLCSGCEYSAQVLAGFRYLHLAEGLTVSETSRVNPALPAGSPFFGGSVIAITDRFDTRNDFYGGQVGFRGEVRRGPLFVEVLTKVALGVTHQTVDARGSTAITPPGGPTAITPVGFLASGANRGHFERDRFSVVPEVGVNAGVQVTHNFRAFVGYNFLYWSSVARPADQINVGLDGTQVPTDTRFNPAGPARPGGFVRDSGFWVQGISFGAEYRF